MGQIRDDITRLIGLVAVGLLAVGLVYAVIGAMDIGALRGWATAATLAVPVVIVVAWRVATNAAREHLAGFDRGVDGAERTIQSVGRGLSAAASMARSARNATPQPGHDDLLPKVGAMTIIDAPRGNGEVIDL
jgi:hypothetical protein